MKKILKNAIIAFVLLLMPSFMFGQTPPNLGVASEFVLFTTVGAMTNTGISQLTGNVGTNNGAVSGFGNVNGVMTYTSDALSSQCSNDLLLAYGELNSQVPTYFPANSMGGDTLISGVYSITGATTLNGVLTLDAESNPNAVFIFQIQGPFSTGANSKIKLINGAKACNVFWKVEGLVDMATGTFMKGTIIANNAAINMNTGDTLEGRAFSIAGAVVIDGVMAYTPVGCGSPALLGPAIPSLSSALCYTVFSASGPVTNAGITFVTGDVGTNVGLTSGFDALNVIGAIHPIPDGSTAAAAADLLNAYTYTDALPYDIELLYPAQFGNNLVLTPHTYLMNGAVTFTDNVYLNAMGDSNAVFVIKTYGAFETSTYSNVILMNGTKPENVYWMVSGAVTINDYSIFNGTIICNGGAMNLNTGVTLNGRALTTTGAIETAAITAIMPPGCLVSTAPAIITEPLNLVVCEGDSAVFTVVATGSDLTYQWRKGTVDLVNGANVSGATSDSLVIFPATILDNASNYNVVVSGSLSPDDISINASLIVNTTPVITTQPVNQTECIGNHVSFSVVATGTNLSYQWRKGNVNLMDGVTISGATSDVLTINPTSILDTASNYNVIVSNSCSADTSINVSLNLNIAPTIVTEPINQTVCTGNSASFSVVATGTNLSYQWRKGNVNLMDGVNISGATSDTLTINPTSILDTASNYNVIVTNVCSADTSINVSLILETAPIITTQLIDQSACAGNAVNFSVVATGSNLTYQWRKGLVDLVNGGNVSGATTALLTIYPAGIIDVASNYNVVVSGACAPSVTSINASLTIDAEPVVITEPVSQFICVGDSVSFTIVATGANLTYQWRKGDINIVDGGNISGATTATLTINPVLFSDTASNYNVVLTGGCSDADTTAVNLNSAKEFGILAGVGISSTGFSVISDMNIGISPGVRSQITGFPPATVVNGSIYASDDIAPPGVAAMLEQAKLDLTNAYLFAEGATAPAPATVAGDQGGLTLAPGIYKSTSTLLIQSGDLTLDAQGNANAKWIFQIASDFTTVGGAGGNVILAGGAQAKNITWQVGSSATIGNGTSFKGNILALTSITMNTGSSIEGKLLARNGSVVLSGTNIINSPSDTLTNSTIDTSNFVSLTVYPLPVADAGPDKTIIMGNSTSIGTPELVGNTYGWTPIIGLNASTDAEPIASPIVTTTYVLTVNSIYGCVNTDTVTVFVTASSNNAPLANNDTIFMCQDGGLIPINVQNNDSDPDGDLLTTSIYAGAIHGLSVLNGNAINYTPNSGFSGVDTVIYVICDNGAPSLCDTAKVFIHVNSTEVINLSASICDGDSIFIAGAYRTLAGIYTESLTTVLGCDSIVHTTLIVNPVYLINLSASICDGDSIFIAGAYRALAGIYTESLTTALGCDSIVHTTLIVNPAYLINLSASICDGDSIFIAGAYRTLAGIYTESLTTVLGCDSIVHTTLIVNPLPIATITPSGATTFCDGNSVVLTSSIGSSYLWNTAQTSQSITVSTSGSYSVTVTNEFGCTASSVSTIVTVNPLPIATITPDGATTFCDGNSVVLTSSIGSSYLWNTAQTSQSITVSTSGSYSVTVTNEFGCTASSVSTVVTVTPLPIAGFTYSVADLFTYTFTNTSVNASTYAWDFGDAHNSTFANPTNVYAGVGVYTVVLVASNSCGSDSAIQVISIVKDISDVEFFNGFSPNGDGQNDYWNIPVLDYYPVNSVLIVNRWGSEVWKGINYDNDNVRWTGQNMNNNDLPDGTYFYIIEYGEVSKRGWVFIKR